MVASDKVFWKVVKECNYLLELQSETRILTDQLTARGDARSGTLVPDPDSVVVEDGPETDPDLLQLAAFKIQEREAAGRLEESFLELAEFEIAALSESASAEELLEQSRSTVILLINGMQF